MTRRRSKPSRLPRPYLPWDCWPNTDRQLWEQALTDDDPFRDPGSTRLSDRTKRGYFEGWRRFLGFLAQDEASALEMTPDRRLTTERVRSFTLHLAETNTPASVAIQVSKVYGAARFMMPERDWTWLKQVKTKLYATAPAMSKARPVITSVQLLDIGQRLMDENKPTSDRPMRVMDAIRYRDGLIIALCAVMPLRSRNLIALKIGTHLLREGDGWHIVIPRLETKARTMIEFAVPKFLDGYLEAYLQIVRPRLLGAWRSDALWVSPANGALGYSVLYWIMARNTRRRLGFPVAPHDFRHAAATTWAIAAPAQIGVAKDLLAHNDARITTKHYNRARGIEASRAQAHLIARIRKGR
jgi:integrase/recombinase XerD